MSNPIDQFYPKQLKADVVLTTLDPQSITEEQRRLIIELLVDYVRHTKSYTPSRSDTNNWVMMEIFVSILRKDFGVLSTSHKTILRYLESKYPREHVLWTYVQHPGITRANEMLPIATTLDD